MNLSVREKKGLIEPSIGLISLQRQCSLINLPSIELLLSSDRNSSLRDRNNAQDRQARITKLPFYGSPRITAALRREGEIIQP